MKTRGDFIGAANHAYDIYEKFMFITARDFFGIADPTIETVTEFQLRNPISTTMTDFHLLHSGDVISEILQKGREVYLEAGDGKDHLIHGLFDDEDHWIGWTDAPTNLPARVRLGDAVMDADWKIYRRYRGYEDDACTIAGVEMSAFEASHAREIFDSLVSTIGKTLGTPLAPYQPDNPSSLPSGLLWNSSTVRVRLSVMELEAHEDEGIDAYRTYRIAISRNEANNSAFHFGCAAEELLK